MTYAKRVGRKAAHYELPDGSRVNGLSRNEKTGRWRIIATGETFREADIGKAIQRFRDLSGANAAWREALDTFNAPIVSGPRVFTDADYLAFADEIRTKPLWVAEKTGIEQIGYLLSLEKPQPLPSFEDLKQTYRDHAACKDKQKAIRAFDDFVKTTKVSDLRGVTVAVATAFKDAVAKRDISDKQRGHIFAGVKTILRFVRERGVAVHEISRALESLVALKKKKTPVALDPKPIERDDWDKLLAAATEAEDEAMILLMLNGALYVEEVRRLQWDDFRDGCLISRRLKTGMHLRVAPLWQETIDALAALPKRDGIKHLFLNYAGKPLGRSGAQKRFNDLAEAASIPNVTGSHLRDGAATAAVEQNVNSELCNVMLGHATGMKDNYVLRNPKMVKAATDAVYAKYFGTN